LESGSANEATPAEVETAFITMGFPRGGAILQLTLTPDPGWPPEVTLGLQWLSSCDRRLKRAAAR
jgi:hypothetical protein